MLRKNGVVDELMNGFWIQSNVYKNLSDYSHEPKVFKCVPKLSTTVQFKNERISTLNNH
jgi:hypothetical protein